MNLNNYVKIVENYPNWDELNPNYAKIDKQVDFLPTVGPFNNIHDFVDDFAVRWTGQIKIVNPGQYKFYIKSDDGSRLYLDGNLVINNDGLNVTRESHCTINLGVGMHDIDIWYFERASDAGIIFSWKKPSSVKAVVPTSVLFHY